MPFTTGADGRVGEAVAAAAARAADRRDTDVLVGGVFISVSSMVADWVAYCIASVSYPSVPLLSATDFLSLCTRGVLLSSPLFDRAVVVAVKVKNKQQNYIQLEMHA